MNETQRSDCCCLIVCFLSVVWVLLSVAARVSEGTSNVHSVWLEAGGGASSPRPDPTGNSRRVLSQRTGLWSIAAQDALANSASSLQPSIAALDQPDSSQSVADRRLDSEPLVSFVNDSSDLATTSDFHHQHQQRGNATLANNGHVQFDEDGSSFAARSARKSLSSSNSDKPNNDEHDELMSTEFYNTTTTSTATTNNPDPSQAVGFVEDFTHPNRPLLTTQSPPPSFINDHPNRTASNRPTSYIYYLTDGDRWNQQHQQYPNHQPDSIAEDPPSQPAPPPPVSHISVPRTRTRDSNNNIPASEFVNDDDDDNNNNKRRWSQVQQAASGPRRKLHTSGTQYDLRERPNQIEHRDRHQPDLVQFVDQLASLRPSAAAESPPAIMRRRQISQVRAPERRFVVQPHPQAPFFAQQPPRSLLDGPLLVQHPQHSQHQRRRQPQIIRPSSQNYRHYLRPSPTNGRKTGQQQQPSRVWRQKSASSSNRNSWLEPSAAAQRSFLQNYVPSLAGGYRQALKLKPASILPSWMLGSPGNSLLENSFYSTDQTTFQQHRSPWNSANNYHGNHHYEQQQQQQHPSNNQQHLYSLLQQQSGSSKPSFASGPTLAPALSSYLQQQQRPNSRDQAAGGFIPVVAVSVTKTSPVPMPATNSGGGSSSSSSSELDAEIAEYQPAAQKHTNNKPERNYGQQQAQVHFDDYGNYASGSSGNPATFGLVANQRQPPAAETTTVKSALFGYLPHEAERPLLNAMNLFSPIQQHQHQHQQQQLASDSHRFLSPHSIQAAGDFALQQQQHGLLEEPPTPLALQLQANSFVQNDIAHPFGSSVESVAAANQRPSIFYLDSAPSNNQQFASTKHEPLPISVQAQQGLMSALLADGSLRSPHLLAAASELNPLMPVMFAAPPLQSIGGQQHEQTESASSSSSINQDRSHVEPSRVATTTSTLNKANKKRSGDFFASAGQLLLSALPLLLAPTLGLMFASSPNAVARYQGQNGFVGEPAAPMPSSYMSGLNYNQGQVSNASPAPLLFTPSPPNSSSIYDELTQAAKQQQKTTTAPTTTTSQPVTLSKAAKPYKPTMGPVQRLASWTGSTPPPHPQPKNYSIILTTLAPPFASNFSSAANKSRTGSQDDGDGSHHTTHTILLIQSLDEQPTTLAPPSPPSPPPPKSVGNNSSTILTRDQYEIGGYEGVDFDAQFPSLRRAAGNQSGDFPIEKTKAKKPTKNHQSESRYHYSQIANSADDSVLTAQKFDYNKPASRNATVVAYDDNIGDQDDNDDVVVSGTNSMKLFPVSRYPLMHRRTVSLVTSNGNKTMPDSSEKYSLHSMVGLKQDNAQLSSSSSATQQVQRRRTKRDLHHNQTTNSTTFPTKNGKKLIKIAKRMRRIMPGATKTNVTDPMMSEPSSGRVRFEEQDDNSNSNSKSDKRIDHKSEPSAHIIATMVAQMNDPEENEIELRDSRERSRRSELTSERQLRDQLLGKKIVLDRLATTSGDLVDPSDRRLARSSLSRRRRPLAEPQPNEDEDFENFEISAGDRNLSSGGRARLPAEIISAKVKLREQADSEERRKRSHRNSVHEANLAEANLVLADDTRKALAKFGNLLIKDTLQIPYSGGDDGGDGRSSRIGEETKHSSRDTREDRQPKHHHHHHHRKSAISGQLENEDPSESSATERSYSVTTAYPPPSLSSSSMQEMRSQQYRQEPNSSQHYANHHNHHYGEDSQYYGGGGGGAGTNYSSQGGQQHAYRPIRDQVNLIPDHDHDHIGSGYGPPDAARDERRSPTDNYSGAPINLVASRYAQPDRYNRPAEPHLYSNYSSTQQNQEQHPYYSRPFAREPPPPGRSHYERGHYGGYNYPANGSQSSYAPLPPPPANHRPADDYYDSRRDNFPPPYSGQDERHNHNHNHNHQARYPPDRYQAASQEHESWPPPPPPPPPRAISQHHEHNQNPSYGGPNYPPPPPTDRESAYTNLLPPQQADGSQPPPAPMSRSIAGDSSAVNEYLKRVQFSDSDRDKLMASYLTCDGLLNDNDHCLERLSCEFSDPQNIERANKLDRAVSSILLGHILINTYIPNQFKVRLKSASLFGYTNSGNCSKYNCNKLAKSTSSSSSPSNS